MRKPPRNVGPPKRLPTGDTAGARFARLIYVRRMQMGLTSMGALALSAKISPNRIKTAERGVLPDPDIIRQLCRALKLDPVDVAAQIGA